MKIEEILENEVIVSYDSIGEYGELINHYVLFNGTKKIVGEIINIKDKKLIVRLIGVINNNEFVSGIANKPSYNSTVQIINDDVTSMINSYPNNNDSLYIGNSAIIENNKIYMNLTKFFNSHFAIIGSTGSGKSFCLSRIIQTLLNNTNNTPYNASLFIFDTYGEYYPSFSDIEKNNPNILFKNYSTNPSDTQILKIPPFY